MKKLMSINVPTDLEGRILFTLIEIEDKIKAGKCNRKHKWIRGKHENQYAIIMEKTKSNFGIIKKLKIENFEKSRSDGFTVISNMGSIVV